jgi:hypothetical protein
VKPPSHVAEDLRMLRLLCARATELDEDDDSDARADGLDALGSHDANAFQPATRKAFRDMLSKLENGLPELSQRQREWVRGIFDRVFDDPQYENLFSSGNLCLGKPVETPEVLRRENLPLKPPGRR